MPKPWLKMWGEWIDDPKMNHLSLAEQCAWWRLVTLAHRCDADGHLTHGNGLPLTLDEIIEAIRCGDRKDSKSVESMMAYMIEKGSLHWNDKTLVVTNLKKRQETAASETPEAVRERVRRYRERLAVTEKSLQTPEIPQILKDEVGLPPTPPLIDKERDIDKRERGNGVTSLHSVTETPSSEPKETRKPLQDRFGFAKNVQLSDEELKKLQEKFGSAGAEERIDALSLYKGSTGKKYLSDYLTILNWERMKAKGIRGGPNGKILREKTQRAGAITYHRENE